jgi:hypothetical protein
VPEPSPEPSPGPDDKPDGRPLPTEAAPQPHVPGHYKMKGVP